MMERVGRITKNASALVVAKLVTSVLFFVSAIIVNRTLGPQKAGIYVYAMTLYMIFQVVPDFGLGNIFIRDVSPSPWKIRKYLKNVVSMRIMLGIVSFVLLVLTDVVTTLLQHSDPLAGQRFWVIFIVAFCLLLEQPFSNSLSEAFIALERLIVVAYVYTIAGFIRVALSMYVVLSGAKHAIVLLVCIYILTILYSIVHFYVAYKRAIKRMGLVDGGRTRGAEAARLEGRVADVAGPVEVAVGELGLAIGPEAGASAGPELVGLVEASGVLNVEGTGAEEAEAGEGEPRIDFDLWRYLLRSAWPLAVASAGIVLYSGMDVTLLSWIKGSRAVGLYSASAMFAKAFAFLTIAINMAILPAVSIVGNKRPERLGDVWERLLKYALLIVVPLTVIVPVLARPLLLLQKHGYVQAWSVVWITMAAFNFTLLASISYPFFVVINKQKKLVQLVGLGLVFKVALGVCAISLWGYNGAAVTSFVTDTLAFLIICYLLSRAMEHKISPLKFGGIPALMLAVLYGEAFVLQKLLVTGKSFKHAALGTIPYALLISVIIVITYAALAFITRSLSRQGLNELSELLKVE